MEQSYNPEEKLKKMLKDLPKVNATEGFEDRLMLNIQKFDRGEDIHVLRDETFNWKRAAISLAAGILIAFTSLQYLSTDGANTNTTKSNAAIAKDTVKNKDGKTFDRPLNLVKEKK